MKDEDDISLADLWSKTQIFIDSSNLQHKEECKSHHAGNKELTKNDPAKEISLSMCSKQVSKKCDNALHAFNIHKFYGNVRCSFRSISITLNIKSDPRDALLSSKEIEELKKLTS